MSSMSGMAVAWKLKAEWEWDSANEGFRTFKFKGRSSIAGTRSATFSLMKILASVENVVMKIWNIPLGIKDPVHRIGKNRTEIRLDWKRPDFQLQFDHSMKKKTEKKPMKPNQFEPVWLGSNRTCVVLVNTPRLQLFWRKTVKNCMCQNNMLPSNLTCTTTCSYCFLRCRKLLSL